MRDGGKANETSVTPPYCFIESPVTAQAIECVCVLKLSILPLSKILPMDAGTIPSLWYFIFTL